MVCNDPDTSVTDNYQCTCPACSQAVISESNASHLKAYFSTHEAFRRFIHTKLLGRDVVCKQDGRVGCLEAQAINYDPVASVPNTGRCKKCFRDVLLLGPHNGPFPLLFDTDLVVVLLCSQRVQVHRAPPGVYRCTGHQFQQYSQRVRPEQQGPNPALPWRLLCGAGAVRVAVCRQRCSMCGCKRKCENSCGGVQSGKQRGKQRGTLRGTLMGVAKA